MSRPQKITFAEMREMGLRGVVIYCTDYHCSHSMAVNAAKRRSFIEIQQALEALSRAITDERKTKPPLDESRGF